MSPKLFNLLVGLKSSLGGEVQLTDGLCKLLSIEGLNGFRTDADIYDCGNKLGFLSANLAVGMVDAKSRTAILAI